MNIEEYYNEEYYRIAKDCDSVEYEKLKNVFKENNPKNKEILDIGCGPGSTLHFLVNENRVLGLDIVDKYLDMAKNVGYRNVIKFNAEDGLPFKSSSFDIIICMDIIEHLLNTELIGAEIRRSLKDEGYAILNVPNHNVLYQRLKFLLGHGINIHNTEDWKYFHIRFFTWKSWNVFLKELGFEIVEFSPVPIVIHFPILKFKIPIMLARRFPNLFSHRFLVKVVKNRE